MKTKSITILQLNEDMKETRYISFSNLDFVNELGIELKKDFYLPVYSTQINTEVESIDTLLEELFASLQFKKPEGYNGHSLSVSDVVEVDGVPYYVDDYGFKQIQY